MRLDGRDTTINGTPFINCQYPSRLQQSIQSIQYRWTEINWYVSIEKELATHCLLRFLEVIPVQGMKAIEKTVSTDEVVMR